MQDQHDQSGWKVLPSNEAGGGYRRARGIHAEDTPNWTWLFSPLYHARISELSGRPPYLLRGLCVSLIIFVALVQSENAMQSFADHNTVLCYQG